MADPQIKNGYTRIANELLEAICRLNISGNEMRILLYIIRRTYGFNRSYAEIPLSDISEALGMKKGNVSRELKKLREANIIEQHSNKGVKPQTLSVVKDYQKWAVETCVNLPLSNSITVIKADNPTVINSDNPTVIKTDNPTVIKTDNHTYKENIKDIIKESFKESKTAYGRNGNVLLKVSEYDKLINDYGSKTAERYIERMDNFILSRGTNFNDCYAELLIWLDRDNIRAKEKSDFDVSKYEVVINKF